MPKALVTTNVTLTRKVENPRAATAQGQTVLGPSGTSAVSYSVQSGTFVPAGPQPPERRPAEAAQVFSPREGAAGHERASSPPTAKNLDNIYGLNVKIKSKDSYSNQSLSEKFLPVERKTEKTFADAAARAAPQRYAEGGQTFTRVLQAQGSPGYNIYHHGQPITPASLGAVPSAAFGPQTVARAPPPAPFQPSSIAQLAPASAYGSPSAAPPPPPFAAQHRPMSQPSSVATIRAAPPAERHTPKLFGEPAPAQRQFASPEKRPEPRAEAAVSAVSVSESVFYAEQPSARLSSPRRGSPERQSVPRGPIVVHKFSKPSGAASPVCHTPVLKISELPAQANPSAKRWSAKGSDAAEATEFAAVVEGVGRYQGQMSGGAFHGYGELRDAGERLLYKGWFGLGEFEGYGVLHSHLVGAERPERVKGFLDLALLEDYWEKYQGYFAKGKFSGVGHLFFANADSFLGEFRANAADGIGVYFPAAGAKVVGIWKNNKLFEKI